MPPQPAQPQTIGQPRHWMRSAGRRAKSAKLTDRTQPGLESLLIFLPRYCEQNRCQGSAPQAPLCPLSNKFLRVLFPIVDDVPILPPTIIRQPFSACLIAPVGHALTHFPHITHLLASIAGASDRLPSMYSFFRPPFSGSVGMAFSMQIDEQAPQPVQDASRTLRAYRANDAYVYNLRTRTGVGAVGNCNSKFMVHL